MIIGQVLFAFSCTAH